MGESMNNKVKIVRSEKSWIESSAVEQLGKVAELKGIIKAVGLPDLHVGKTPVGASFITKDVIYPHIVGNDIGCGMAFFSTGIKKSKFKLDKIVKKLKDKESVNSVDVEKYIEELNVSFPFKDKLGTIGSGNHFAEFQSIDCVYEQDMLEKIGINKGEVYLLVHSGSRNYGEHILRKYIENFSCQNGLEVGDIPFNEYMNEHNDALDYATLNRELIAFKILNAINSGENKKLLDSVHNGIVKKEIEAETFYIHRKGASPSDVGCVVIAGSRGTKSYIVKPAENLLDYAFSVSHGAGRKWPRFGCKERLENMYSKKDIRQQNTVGNLICEDKNIIYEEAPEAYKSIDRVIEDMLNENMISLVASLNPLVTYKV
jgi:release factor H-coupled RctB family protein